MDFLRVRRWLEGTWPVPLPDGVEVPAFASIEDATRAFEAVHPTFCVIDTEYAWREDAVPGHYPLLVLGIAFRDDARAIRCIQFDFRQMTDEQKTSVMEWLARVVSETTCGFQNAAADVPVLAWNGGPRIGEYKAIEDLMLMHAALWSEQPHDLAYLKSLVGVLGEPKDFEHGKGDLVRYNRGDIVDTLAALEVFQAELRGDAGARRTYEQLLRLIPIHTRASEDGVCVNKAAVLPLLTAQIETMQAALRLARAYVGFPIQLGSAGENGQLARTLYQYLGLPVQRDRQTKKVTVKDEAIAALRKKYLAFDEDEEQREGLSVEYVLRRIEQGAHPLLEARVLYAQALQEMSHYLAPLVKT